MSSIWRKEVGKIEGRTPEYDTAKVQQESYDVIVIGAGMAGILTAYFLQEQGKQVLVLEADTIASGQTEGTTAKITSQHGLKYSKLLQTVGLETTKLYAKANEEAIVEYERLIKEKGIDCEFERCMSYLYATQSEEALREEERVAKLIGIDAFFTNETELPFYVLGALGFRNQARFQPLRFVKKLCEELTILENTRVLRVRGREVVTETSVYTVDKIIITSHYPFKNCPGFYFLRQHQERSYCLALSGCGKISGMYLGIDGEELSFRQAGECLLLGGCAHRTGRMKRCHARGMLEELVGKYFPEAEVEAFWAAQDCMPHDGIPFIGKFSVFTPDLYVATGFQKWGMTSSMVAARILCDEICGKKNPYREVFKPQRIHIKAGLPAFLQDFGESVKGLTKGILLRRKPVCTHLGCGLEWNEEEQSWDCPCHGSRFTKEGMVLDNPAEKPKR